MPDADEAMMPTNDAPPGATAGQGLDDLERRLAAFENATKRLNRTVAEAEDPTPSPPPRPATRRLSDSGFARGEEISGLRPAVAMANQGPQTGALTARTRMQAPAPGGFTSMHGRPNIPPAAPVPPPSPYGSAAAPHRRRTLGLTVYIISSAIVAVLFMFVALRSSFARLPDGMLTADSSVVTTTTGGTISDLAIQIGQAVEAGQQLALIGGTPLLAPRRGTVSRVVVPNKTLVAGGETICELTHPESLRVVVEIPAGRSATNGERVHLEMLGGQTSGGMIEAILPAGSASHGLTSSGATRAVILLDPTPLPLRAGQTVRVTPLGSPQPSSLRQALFAVKQMLP